MNHSMADYLKIVTPYLHSNLISSQSLSDLQNLAKILPPFYHAGFECRLGPNSSSRVDLTVSLTRRQLSNLPIYLLKYNVWQVLQKITEEWIDPTSLLYKGMKTLNLEFDIDENSNPIPNIFIEFNSEYVDILALINIILQRFKYYVSNNLIINIQRCINFLPKNTKIVHFGIMLPRPTNAMRIVVEGIQVEHILEYLQQIGFADPTGKLKTIIHELSNINIGFLSFDVGDTIHNRIGLECFPVEQDELGWQKNFEYLINNNLCSLSKQIAVMKWPGWSQKDTVLDLWPEHLDWGDNFLGNQATSVFFRQINHIKIVYQPNVPLDAKIYLSFGHRWLDYDDINT